MKPSPQKEILVLVLLIFSSPLLAINFQTYNNTSIQEANEASQATLLGIVGSCGNASHLDDDCMIQELERVAEEEDNIEAKTIVKDYEKAISEGNFDQPECQTNSHIQVNRTIGHCVLLLNYYKIQKIEDTYSKYELCLQGGMRGLAYAGNLPAAYMLSEIFREKEISETATLWSNFVKSKKGTDEYELLMKCYH